MESALHQRAKERIVEAVASGRVRVKRLCKSCGSALYKPLPPRIVAARIEARTDTGRLVDVGLLDDAGTLVAAVEIFVSHGVQADKQADLRTDGLPVAELRADDVLTDPFTWAPRPSLARPVHCASCDPSSGDNELDLDGRWESSPGQKRWEDITRVHFQTGQQLPPRNSRYWVDIVRCRACSEEMLAYAWRHRGAMTGSPPPEPVPSTLRHDEYWGNVCPHCDALQPNHHGYRPA